MGEIITHHDANNRSGATSQQVSADLAFVAGAKPADPIQSTLAVQMTATHDAAMRALAMVGKAGHVDHLQMYGNLANKLLGTFVRQAEAYTKMQRGGEQVVKHVHVDNRGGQAIVADQVVTGGG